MERRPLLLLPMLPGVGACLEGGGRVQLALVSGCVVDGMDKYTQRHKGSLGLRTCCCGVGCGDLATEERAGLVATLLLT